MIIASFCGNNREFRAWLRARTGKRTFVKAANVVDLTECREKRKSASKKALRKLFNPSIA